MDEETKKMIRTLGYISSIGISMAAAIGIGGWLGLKLDEKFGTEPWLLCLGFTLGVAAAFRNLYRMYKKVKDI
jgi:F0F1-type ATP synthase assembly protein I